MAAKAFGSQIDLKRIPVLGLVPESSTSAPASPVAGQLWYDSTAGRFKVYESGAFVLVSQTGAELTANKNATNGYAGLTSGLLAIGQIPTGQTGTTVPFGNDARFTDQRVPTDASVTGGTAGAGVKIAASTITDANVAAANKSGAAGVESLRQIGLGALQAMAGNTRLDTIAVPTGAVNHNSQEITNLGAPTAAGSAARLQDVQNAQAGIDLKPSVRGASISNLTPAAGLTNGLVHDSVTYVTGDRILLKNQTTTSENGVYIIAASGAASRATDAITPNTLWLVEEGATNADTSWMVTTNGTITVGSTSLTIAQFAAGGTTYTGTANRVTVSGSTIDISAAYVGQSTITTLGTITTGTWNGTAVGVLYGGTGATTAAGARTALGAVGKYTATLGALAAGVETVITHSLGTDDVVVAFRRASDDYDEVLNWRRISTTTIGVTADVAYSASALKVTVIG